MKKHLLSFVILSIVLGLFFSADSYAAIYKYIDKNGIVCLADDLQAVPQNYRASAALVEGDAKEDDDKKPAPVVNNPVEEAQSPVSSEMPRAHTPRPLSFRLIVSAAVILAAFGLFIAMTRHAKVKENQKAQTLIRTCLVLIVCGYLILAHAKDVMIGFGAAGKAIDDVQQRSAEKGKKAAQAIKTLDTMFEDAQKAMDSPLSDAPDGDKK